MPITDHAIDQAYADLMELYGGNRNDYFGLLYLEQEFGLERERALSQVAFGGNDYGVDGFHFDAAKRNLYLFQFKWTESPAGFKQSLQRLRDAGMQQIFGAASQDPQQNQLLQQLKSCLIENEAIIDRVFIYLVFRGDPAEAERSQVLDKLREDLENKKYLIDQRLGRSVPLVIEFRSARTHRVGGISHSRITHAYTISLGDTITRTGPSNEQMIVGFVRALDLCQMYQEMGERFLERNIRGALPEHQAVNRAIRRSIKATVFDGTQAPSAFAFNHNGVAISAEAVENLGEGQYRITEPRLINGAQTVATFVQFLKDSGLDTLSAEARARLEQIHVMCRIITQATPEFITICTINNNRQNPVKPWNLRANDMIQLELQDKFRNELGIYYERQEGTFRNLSDEQLNELGITQFKPIELTRLARTFLVSDGELDKLNRFSNVFEDESQYNLVFNESRVRCDARKILLCYKIQFRLRKLAEAIYEKGVNKYAYVMRCRNLLWALLCQAILNDEDLEEMAERFGRSLSIEVQYVERLRDLATTRCRFILSDLTADPTFKNKVEEGNFSFMRTKRAYDQCMDIAYKRWHWVKRRLK